MKVFLSWSGPRSKEAALLFRKWLPKVIQAVDPWMSDIDIEKGAQWFAEISREVSEAAFGIVFLTRENLEKTWLHFEAGALAKALEGDRTSGRVAAYLLGIEPSDVQGPLKEFQHTRSTQEDTLRLLTTINAQLAARGERPLKDDALREIFAMAWPALESDLMKLNQAQAKETRKPQRRLEDMVEEILEYVRPRANQPALRQKVATQTALRTAAELEAEIANTGAMHAKYAAEIATLQASLEHLGAIRQQLIEKRGAARGDAERADADADVKRWEEQMRVTSDTLTAARAQLAHYEVRLALLRETQATMMRARTMI